MRVAVVQFPGSNCERETKLAIARAGMTPVDFLWNQPVEALNEMDGLVLAGGFSYEDRSRAGIIAALDPVMAAIKKQSEQGKAILGICNGAQILVESGLVPGIEGFKLGMALTENKRQGEQEQVLGTGYYNAWVHMRVSDHYQRNAFTRCLSPQDILSVPIAHAEGRFAMNRGLLDEIQVLGLNVFQYCNSRGEIIDEFPINPNGSVNNIAAVSNKAGNVMAMMPHPERTLKGGPIFQSMRDYIEKKHFQPTLPLYYYPRKPISKHYRKAPHHEECLIELMISDHHALTVQSTLRQLGISVTVKRYAHWEWTGKVDLQTIKQTGVLWNERKEREVHFSSIHADPELFLVRSKEDFFAQEKLQILKNHFDCKALTSLKYGDLWHFSFKNATIAERKTKIEQILNTNIIMNPYAHDSCQYRPSLS